MRADRCAKLFDMELLLNDAKLTYLNILSHRSLVKMLLKYINQQEGRKNIETFIFTEKIDYTYNSKKNIVSIIMNKH